MSTPAKRATAVLALAIAAQLATAPAAMAASKSAPAGGAAIGQVIAATLGAMVATAAMLWIVVGHRSGRLLKNGASIVTNLMSVRAISGDDTIVSGQVILALAARDYVELQAYQTSGGDLNVRSGPEGTWFSILYVGE